MATSATGPGARRRRVGADATPRVDPGPGRRWYAGRSLILAIGDVHGCVDELRELLAKLPCSPETTIVFLGDYVDRGPASREVIETILELGQRCNVVALKGNHEEMFLDYLEAPASPGAASFIYNGGSATLASYANAHGEVTLPAAHLGFLRSLPVMHQTEDHVFVHAGLPQLPLDQLDLERDAATMLWTRGQFLKTRFDWGKVVVHGHTPVPRVTQWPNRINIDTGCVFRGRLTALALPGETRFSVRRMGAAPQVVLRDPAGIRQAYRFTGSIPVLVRHGERVLEFLTVDYSELGMYLRAVDPGENLRLGEGKRIEGVVGPASPSPVGFTAIIVRRRVDDLGVHYGVKLLETRPFEPPGAASDDPASAG